MPNIVARIALHLALACVLLEARVQGAGEGSTPPSDTGTCGVWMQSDLVSLLLRLTSLHRIQPP